MDETNLISFRASWLDIRPSRRKVSKFPDGGGGLNLLKIHNAAPVDSV